MGFKESLVIIAGIVATFWVVPYIIDIYKGKTHPNFVTWFTWTLLTGIGTFAAIATGAWEAAILTGGSTIATGVVSVLAVTKSNGLRFTRFDKICLLSALLGVVLWRITNQPELAIAISIIADLLGALPTYRHAWHVPHAETWPTFGLLGIASILTLASLTTLNFASLAYPMYLAVLNFSIAAIIVFRRIGLHVRAVAEADAEPAE